MRHQPFRRHQPSLLLTNRFPLGRGLLRAVPEPEFRLLRKGMRASYGRPRQSGMLARQPLGIHEEFRDVFAILLFRAKAAGGKRALFEACSLLLHFLLVTCERSDHLRILKAIPRSLLRNVIRKVDQGGWTRRFRDETFEPRQLYYLYLLSNEFQVRRLMPDLVQLPMSWLANFMPFLYGGVDHQRDLAKLDWLCSFGVPRTKLIEGMVVRELSPNSDGSFGEPNAHAMELLIQMDAKAARLGIQFVMTEFGADAPYSIVDWRDRVEALGGIEAGRKRQAQFE